MVKTLGHFMEDLAMFISLTGGALGAPEQCLAQGQPVVADC